MNLRILYLKGSARKAPLIDIAMSAIAAPTMPCMFGIAAKGIAEVRKGGKLNLPLEMALSP